QGGLPAGEKLLSPLGQGGRRPPKLPRQAIERLAAQHPQDRRGLPPGREASRLAHLLPRRGPRRAPQGPRIPPASPHVPLPGGASPPPARCAQKKTVGGGLPDIHAALSRTTRYPWRSNVWMARRLARSAARRSE